MTNYLSDRDIAVEYVARNGIANAQALVRWLTRRGISHRDSHAIALEINKLQAERSEQNPAPSEVQALWDADQREGISDRPRELDELARRQMDELALAARIRDMPMSEYSASFRAQAGIQRSVGDFLLGTGN